MSKHFAAAAAIALAALPSLAFGYTLEKAGRVFTPPGYYDASSCRLRDGTSLNLNWEQVQDSVYELRLEHRGSDFQLLSPSIPLKVGAFWSPELACSTGGEALVSWGERECVTAFRLVSADHRSAGDVRTWPNRNDWYCGTQSFAVWGNGYAVTWTTTTAVTYDSDIWLQAFDRSGTAAYEPVRVSTSAPNWRGSNIAGADAEGNVVVSWEEGTEDRSPDPYDAEARTVAVAVSSSGESSGSPLEIVRGRQELVGGGPLRVNSTDVGTFDVVWSTDLADWYVAQPIRIAEIAPQTTTTTTTSTTLEDDPTPVFGDEQGWSRAEIYSGIQPKLASDGTGGWLAMWAGWSGWWGRDWSVVSTSSNGGRSWSRTSEFEFNGLDILSDLAGEWLAVGAHSERGYESNITTLHIQLSHSASGATEWSEAKDIAAFDGPNDDDCWTSLYDLKVARGRSGALVVAWAQQTSCDNRYPDENTTDRAFSIRSLDNGESWSEPVLLWTKFFEGYDNGSSPSVSLVPVGDDDFLVMLFGQAWVSMRTDDGGATWSDPVARTLPRNLTCDSSNRCLAVSDGYTWFSNDGAVTWREAIANSFDAPPTLATNDDGIWTAVWSSHRMLGAKSGPDADLLLASSSDEGRTWTAPRVLSRAAADDGWMRDDEAVLEYDAGSWVTLWSRRPPGGRYPDSFAPEARVAAAFADCGNDSLDEFEQCDDGNRTSGDGCDANCYVTACPNGIATAGEECDDGNDLSDDTCTEGCRIATCGDGYTRFGVEECDDANSDDADACTNGCKLARCRDGIVAAGIEECDDGNTSNEDSCPTSCRIARCGDGFVLDGVEECDDANTDTTDSCPADCRLARCGDGYVWQGIEPCDTAASQSCAANCGLSECGDVNGDGQYTAGDARDILYRSVGKPVVCPLDSCDVDGNFWISTRDSLMTLGLSVGLDYTTRCTGGPWLTVRLQDTRKLGALQVRVDLSGLPISVLKRPNGVAACAPLQLGALTAGGVFGNILTVGTISMDGIRGPADVVRCRVSVDGDVRPGQIPFTIEDATTTTGDPVDFAQVGVRITD